MELTNQIIQEDLNKMYKKHNQWGAIVLYFIIIVLFVLLKNQMCICINVS